MIYNITPFLFCVDNLSYKFFFTHDVHEELEFEADREFAKAAEEMTLGEEYKEEAELLHDTVNFLTFAW